MKRRQALVRIAAPVARLAVRPVPPAGGPPAHDASRRAFRRFTAAISDPGTVTFSAGWVDTPPRDRTAFTALPPAPNQPTEGQPLLVGTDGDPWPPGGGVTSPARGRRIPPRSNDVS